MLKLDLFLCVLPFLASSEIHRDSYLVPALWWPGALEEILEEENQQEIHAGNLGLSQQQQENCQEEFREGSPVESIQALGAGSPPDLEMGGS